MNLNELAKEISRLECGKKEISIAQIKEVIKCISIVLYEQAHGDQYDWCVNNDIGWRLWRNGKKHLKKRRKKVTKK